MLYVVETEVSDFYVRWDMEKSEKQVFKFLGLSQFIAERSIKRDHLSKETGISIGDILKIEGGHPVTWRAFRVLFNFINDRFYDGALSEEECFELIESENSESDVKKIATATAVGAFVGGVASEIGTIFGSLKNEISQFNVEIEDIVSEKRVFYDLRNTLRTAAASAVGVSGIVYFLNPGQIRSIDAPINWYEISQMPEFSHKADAILRQMGEFSSGEIEKIEENFRVSIKNELLKFSDTPLLEKDAQSIQIKVMTFFGEDHTPSFDLLFERFEHNDDGA